MVHDEKLDNAVVRLNEFSNTHTHPFESLIQQDTECIPTAYLFGAKS